MTEPAKTSRWWLLPLALIALYCVVMATTAIRSDQRDERRLRIDSAFTVSRQRDESLKATMSAKFDSAEIARMGSRGKD